MTTWSVVKDDTKENLRPARYIRYGILASVAVLVISLGLVLAPRTPPEAPKPAFSELARASALAEVMRLRLSGSQLADGTAGAERQALLQAVTLLTIQARALTSPDHGPSSEADGTAVAATPLTGTEVAATVAVAASGDSTVPSSGASGTAASTAATESDQPPASAEALVAALSASSRQRLADAAAADGGMARLLSAVGAGQLIQASALAPALGAPAPEFPAAMPPAAAGSCQAPGTSSAGSSPGPSSPEGPAGPAPTPSGQSSGTATLAAALAMTVKTEAETVYGYQVALARLEGSAAGSASQLLARHESVVGEAEALSRAHCVDIPPREAGYTLGPLFLEAPAAGLGSLEAGTLPVYGDLVALSEGSTRQWAVAGLVSASRRAALWGADAGPLPGIVVDTAQLPLLPDDGPAKGSTEPPAPTVTGQREH
jgi:hypothetical protein